MFFHVAQTKDKFDMCYLKAVSRNPTAMIADKTEIKSWCSQYTVTKSLEIFFQHAKLKVDIW